jgi:predicted restriction endonuclease
MFRAKIARQVMYSLALIGGHMDNEKPKIDIYLFEQQFDAFLRFVEEKDEIRFVSFASHPYVEQHEIYKYEIYSMARKALSFQKWTENDIGSGKIIADTIGAIELQQNNLVAWQARFGEQSRPHQPLYEASNVDEKTAIEAVLFGLYRGENDGNTFGKLIEIFGRRYAILAYLYFIKDRSKYMPIAPTYFDRAFQILGVEYKTSYQCSWENYSTYNGLIFELKIMLSEKLSSEVTLLDSHSFAWILSSQMWEAKKLADVQHYLELSGTEREAIVKARIGQGLFRKNLLDYWSVCAVTGCVEPRLLRASHIKPWSESNLSERLNLYNGLLLSPALDACFDAGFISFDSKGHILISSQLDVKDQTALGIDANMQLAKLTPEHQEFLHYHRKHILK